MENQWSTINNLGNTHLIIVSICFQTNPPSTRTLISFILSYSGCWFLSIFNSAFFSRTSINLHHPARHTSRNCACHSQWRSGQPLHADQTFSMRWAGKTAQCLPSMNGPQTRLCSSAFSVSAQRNLAPHIPNIHPWPSTAQEMLQSMPRNYDLLHIWCKLVTLGETPDMDRVKPFGRQGPRTRSSQIYWVIHISQVLLWLVTNIPWTSLIYGWVWKWWDPQWIKQSEQSYFSHWFPSFSGKKKTGYFHPCHATGSSSSRAFNEEHQVADRLAHRGRNGQENHDLFRWDFRVLFICWLVVYQSIWKIWKSVGMIPNIWTNRINVPNHRPDLGFWSSILSFSGTRFFHDFFRWFFPAQLLTSRWLWNPWWSPVPFVARHGQLSCQPISLHVHCNPPSRHQWKSRWKPGPISKNYQNTDAATIFQ